MSFKAHLKITGVNSDKPFSILSCSYGFSRATDSKGKAQSLVQGGIIHMSLETYGDTSLSDWMFSPYDFKDDSIDFFKVDSKDAVSKTLKFTNSSLVDYSESFSSEGGSPMMGSLSISAEIIEIGHGKHDNEWPTSS